MKGILGRKLGMTQVFTEDGTLIPVTVVEACPNVVLQKKTVENDGYEAVQLGFEDIKETRSTKPNTGHAAKANTAPKRFMKEVRNSEFAEMNLGDEVKVDIFAAGETVDVIGTSKGKGSWVQLFVTMRKLVLRATVQDTTDTSVLLLQTVLLLDRVKS